VADWATISSLATAGGTLVLALATFSSVRSANRAARVAERALMAGLTPVLVPARSDDPPQKIFWVDEHWTRLEGGTAAIEVVDDVIYLSVPLRNVGAGLAVLQAWRPWPEADTERQRPPMEEFRPQSRDIYVPVGDVGFWQGAFRDVDDPLYAQMRDTVLSRRRFQVDLCYTDHEGGQRTISRFALTPVGDDRWLPTVGRHWTIDVPDPRSGDGR
jgi:hypothetical protein